MDDDVGRLGEDPRLTRGLLYATLVVAILFTAVILWLGGLLIERSEELETAPSVTGEPPGHLPASAPRNPSRGL